MDLVAKGHTQEARTFFNSFHEDHELMHLRDLQKLEGILSPSHLEEMEFAHSLRQSKVNIKICQLLEDSLEERLEEGSGLLSDSEKTEGENKDGDLEENKKRLGDGGKQGNSVKKLKKDKIVGATGKSVRSETNIVPMAPRVKPELTLPVMPIEVEHSILEDLRNRVHLSSSISHDGSLVAGGFSNSSLKVWDMSKMGRQVDTSNMQGEDESVPSEHSMGSGDGKRSHTLFQGHASPVYSATFSPLGDFILSSSSDSTIQSHGSMGHYFASSSHDLSARIWSMDRIQPLRITAGHLSDLDCVQWHANCNYIATGSSDKTVRLWDVHSGECVRIFIGHGYDTVSSYVSRWATYGIW